MRRKTYESNLSKLESWAKKNNVKIVFGRHGELGEYDMHTKTIIVDSRLSNEKKIFVILHECGHALGLEHPHDDRDGDIWYDTDTNDTVMSYNWIAPVRAFRPADVDTITGLYS